MTQALNKLPQTIAEIWAEWDHRNRVLRSSHDTCMKGRPAPQSLCNTKTSQMWATGFKAEPSGCSSSDNLFGSRGCLRQWRKKAYAHQSDHCHWLKTVYKLLSCQKVIRSTSAPRCLCCPDQRPNPNTSKRVFFKMHPVSFMKTGLKTITEKAHY